jgi:hypothetical protein
LVHASEDLKQRGRGEAYLAANDRWPILLSCIKTKHMQGRLTMMPRHEALT